MPGPTFPPARVVAGRIEAFFARQRAEARAHGHPEFAPAPDAETIETLIDAAFWASLRREEGLTPKISLAFLPIETANDPLALDAPLPLEPAGLAKLAPAVERPGIHLGVWPIDGILRVWGTTRNLPPLCFVIEVVASGLLVVKQRGEPFGKFINVAVIEGDQIKIVDERTATLPECPGVLKSFMHADVFERSSSAMNVLVELAASMRVHGRGGTLLVVPARGGAGAWMESIVNPITYRVSPRFTGLSSLLDQPTGVSQDEWQDDLHRAVAAIAGLTAVDGATLLSDQLELLAFGAKIIRRRGSDIVERVVVTEPIEGSVMAIAAPALLGGTRHLSAAQFVHDQRDASALVASQDGRFTVFTWSPTEDAVHAHRIEALLL
jgi:hypothetical protein